MLETVLAFLAGLLIGSFLNVCIYRLPRDLSVIRPRSYCPLCEHTIAWYDNVPLLSYVLLRSRCRHCGGGISARYPAVEILTGGLFAAAVWIHGPTSPALKLCIFTALLVELIFSDIEERILPDEFTLGGSIAGLLLAFIVPMDHGLVYVLMSPGADPVVISVAESAAGALLTGGAMWLVAWLYEKIRHREGLGYGDIKMVALIGAFLGIHQTLLVLILGSIAGSVIGLLFILITRKDASSYELPYGTFLGAAAVLYAFYSAV